MWTKQNTEAHSNKLLTAFDAFLKPKKMSNGIVRVSQGAQFSRIGAVAGWFIMMFLLLIAIVLIVQGMFLSSIPIFLICFLMIVYIMDYQGIEIHPSKGKIRSYTSFLGAHFGDWYLVENFNRLIIYQDTLLQSRMMNSGSTYAANHSFDTNRFYVLYMISDDGNQLIKLYEDESVTKVKIAGANFSSVSELELVEQITKRKPDIIR